MKRNEKIANIQVLLAIMVVFIHANTLFINVPGHQMQSVLGVNVASFIQLFICDGVSRIAVPMFAFFSGYLLYVSYDGTVSMYLRKSKTRVKSLLVPYLFWSTITFVAYYCANAFLGLGEMFTTRNETDLSFEMILDNVVLHSYDTPLWYVKYVFILSVFLIVFYHVMKKAIVLSLVLWVGVSAIVFFVGESPGRMYLIIGYAMGAIIAVHARDLLEFRITKWVGFCLLLLWLGIVAIRCAMCMHMEPMDWYNSSFDFITEALQVMGVVVGILAVWFAYDNVGILKESRVAKYTFFVFVVHSPIIDIIRKLLSMRVDYNGVSAVLLLFLQVIVSIPIIIGIGTLIRRNLRRVWVIINGRE